MERLHFGFKPALRGLLADRISFLLNIPEQSIDFNESFVSMGGDSIAAIALASACKRVEVNLNASAVLLSKSIQEIVDVAVANVLQEHKRTGQSSAPWQTSCERHCQDACFSDRISRKRKISACLDEGKIGMVDHASKRVNTCVDSATEGREPLTEMQSLLLQGCSDDKISNIITYSETYKLSDLAKVKAAWQRVAAQEPLLRRRMIVDSDNLTMKSTSEATLQWDEVETDSHEEFQHQLQTVPGPTIVEARFRVIKLDRGLHRQSIATVVWQVHHALIDGYAASLLYANFQNALNGKPSRPSSPFPFVARQLRSLQKERASEAQQFWKLQEPLFKAAASELRLPRPIVNARRKVGSMSKVVVQSPVAELDSMARQLDCTLASVYMTAWSIVLSRYLCSECVSFGVVMSGRSLPIVGIENAMGPLINTLPLGVRLEQGESLENAIRTVFGKLTRLGGMEFSRASDGFERSFSTAVAMQFDMEPAFPSTVRPIQKAELHISSEVPLSVCIGKDGEIQLFYQDAVFRESDMMLIGEHLERTLEQMLDHSKTVGSCLDSFLTHECQEGLDVATNSRVPTTRIGFRNDTLLSLFEQSASRYPTFTAVERDGVKISYSALRQSILRLASSLREVVRPRDAVCVLADRSVNWIIGIYAVLFLGGVYVPLNPASSPEAREVNFRECHGQVFLTPYDSQSQYRPTTCRTSFSIESILSKDSGEIDGTVHRETVVPNSAAYICFTSGSTGKPKAVVCTHEGLVAFQSQFEVRLMAGPGIRIAQMMSPVFDGSIHEIFSALSYGATLVLASSAGGPVGHLSTVDSTIMTPSLAAALDPDAFPDLKVVYLVGEAVPQKVCDAWAINRHLYNMYGPTEATCGATIARLQPKQPVTIGRPNSTSRIYILDDNKRQTPPGVIGEIYLAGVQVAKGYMDRLEETQARFLHDTVYPELGEMMYRTGDFGHWSSAGEIICTGRKDRQIKLRGFRVDLNNLESRIARAIPGATGVAVTHKQGRLLAMIRPSKLSIDDIRCHLPRHLEPQFIPNHLVVVDDFPLSVVGKVDYAKVADAALKKMTQKPPEPMGRTELQLLNLWKEILDITDTKVVGASSNFLSLGGHSISQLVLVGRIEKVFGCHLDKKAVLDSLASGTLRDLAHLIDMQPLTPPASSSVGGSSDHDTKPDMLISNVEAQWWDLYRRADETSQFNVSLAWELKPGKVDIDRLTRAWNAVLERHGNLRSRYIACGTRKERVHTSFAPTVSRVESIDMDQECNRPFDIEKDFLIRVIVSPTHLLVCASHIILDLTAARTILAEVGMAYAGQTLTQTPRSYAASLKHTTTMSPQDAAFWKANLADAVNARRERLTIDSVRSSRGSSLLLRLGSDVLRGLESVACKHQATKHQVALAAVSIALSTDSQYPSSDILVGAPWNNRSADNHNVVGLFLELLPIVISRRQYDGSSQSPPPPPPGTLLCTARQASQNSLAHAAPWSDLCRSLAIQPRGDGPPLSTLMLLDAMVTFHEHSSSPLTLDGLEPVLTWSQGAKFRIMFEFSACEEHGELLLRVEYNSSVYSYAQALELTHRACGALKELGCGEGAVEEERLIDRAPALFGKTLG